MNGCHRAAWRSSLERWFGAPHAVAVELDTVGIVDEAVEDSVGVGRIADGVMPGGDGQLAGDDGGLATVAILQDLEQIVAGLGIEGLQAPVIEDEQFDLGEALEPAGDAPVAAGERQFLEQARETGIEDGAVVAACLVPDGAGEPGLADAGRAADRQVVMRIDPLALEERVEEPAVETAGFAVVDVLGRGLMAQPGKAQPC